MVLLETGVKLLFCLKALAENSFLWAKNEALRTEAKKAKTELANVENANLQLERQRRDLDEQLRKSKRSSEEQLNKVRQEMEEQGKSKKDIVDKLSEIERGHREKYESLTIERAQLTTKMNEMMEKEKKHTERLEEVQRENDAQLKAAVRENDLMKARFERERKEFKKKHWND